MAKLKLYRSPANAFGKPKRLNFKVLLLGTIPPLVLMAIATLLDSVWKLYHNTVVLNIVLIVCGIIIVGSIVKYAYLPWVMDDRRQMAAKVYSSAFVAIVMLVYVAGFAYVALALGILGIILAVKSAKENPQPRTDEDDSWYSRGDSLAGNVVGLPAMSPFEVLGISPDATDEEIKTAYRLTIKKCHPDSSNGTADTARFRMAIDAYRVLMEDKA
ncbi:MAG: J domain-containing protein [Rectinemataceae bacterium]